MKITLALHAAKRASTLLVTLIIGSILGLAVVGYLTVIEQQNVLSARSQAWNMAMAIVEAGIEDGLEQLNSNRANLEADGWSFDGTLYSHLVTLADGNAYMVTIDIVTDPYDPSVTARAFINAPGLSLGTGMLFFAGVGLNDDPTTVSRAVRVRTSRGNLLIKAMAAKHQIDMNGNNVTTDSFDSTDPFYSTNGRYDPAKVKDGGDVASNDTILNSINIGNANIYGHVATGPGGTVAIGPNGGVGTHVWQASNTGFEPGYITHDSNFTIPDTAPPAISGLPPTGGCVVTTNYGFTNFITSSTYPNPAPISGVVTNRIPVITNVWPNPPPAGITTNTTYTTVTVRPNPAPPGMTATAQTESTRSKNYPATGTYLPPVTQKGAWYYYNLVIGTNYTYPNLTYSYSQYTYTYSLDPPILSYTTNCYDHILNNGDYYLDTLSGTTLVLGQARLVCNTINMSGNDKLTIASGAALTNYVTGTSASIGGNGVVNQNGFAGSYFLSCAPSVTSVSLKGNGTFTGVLLAPNADLTLNGSGNDPVDFVGALLVNSVKMNGHFKFHYDEALSKMSGNGRYLVTSWDEL